MRADAYAGPFGIKVKSEPVRTTVCHCTFCQHVTGSAFVADALFTKDAVSIQGTFSTYDHRSDESGYLITLQFCPRCGTTFGMTFERFPDVQGIMIGTLDDPNWPRIDKHQFTRSAFRWMQFPPAVPRFECHPNPARKPNHSGSLPTAGGLHPEASCPSGKGWSGYHPKDRTTSSSRTP